MDELVNVHIVVPGAKLGALYAAVGALLGGTALATTMPAAAPAPSTVPAGGSTGDGLQATALKAAGEPVAGAAAADAGTDAGELDAAGWPWSADLHASTKGKTKDGLWRMKVGVSRPDPKPGFPVAGAAPTADAGASAGGAGSAPFTPDATAPAAEEDDEFAAFREAAAASNATDAAAAGNVPARKWTDADLGALCNQAAVKLGDPAPVKALIAEHVPEGTVPHSRNIPEDKREAFAKAVEAKAGIEFAG